MTNFLEETRTDINTSGHTPEDIVWIGSRSGWYCTWEQFESMANFNYDPGYGAAIIPGDLIIVFADGQTMYRGENDGSEWWEFSAPFIEPAERRQIERLQSPYNDMWPSLDDLHAPGGKYHREEQQ